ncbi:MAG: hypothetical protein GY888_25895, partial [Planctomycetaceae bacterium]|nr:hypothetical protein [Planctomycetaceae bacterium]
MAQEFAIDVLSHRLSECEFWEALIPQQLAIAEQAAAYDKLTTLLKTIVSDAEAAERYDIAVPACEQAFRMDPSSTWRARKEQLELGSTRYLGYSKATELLKNNPDDPAANLATGKYLGFTRTDWAKAMPYLARGSDGQLRQLAKAEQQDPADSAGMKAMGDLWLEHAENDADPEDQLTCYRRAATWYQQSLDNEESPIRKLVVEKKLDNLLRSKLTVPEEEVVAADQSPTTPEKADVAINKITLDFSQRIVRYRVELPEAINTDNLVLRVNHLGGFPEGTTVITPDGIVPTEKELLIGFDNDPLKVRFRLKLSLFNRIAIIQVRSTFRRLETAKTDVVLTASELEKAIVANNYSLNKDTSELAAWGKEIPSLERDLRNARSQSTLNLARAKYNRASSRVFYLNNAVRRTRSRVQRLLAIQNALSKIHQTATIHFDIVPAPTGN